LFLGLEVEYQQLNPIQSEIFTDDKFDSVDALVLEAYQSEEWFKLFWKSDFKQRYDTVFAAVQRTNKPLYVVDVLTTPSGRAFESVQTIIDLIGLYGVYDGCKGVKQLIDKKIGMTRRNFWKCIGFQSGKIVGGAYLVSHFLHERYTMNTGKNPEFLAKANSLRMHLIPTPQFELRNAISARKIEEFIAPELQESLGRKPCMALFYGAGHSGLKEDLQSQGLRDSVLQAYGFLGYPGIDTTYLDTITTLSITPEGNYSLQHRKAGLF